MSKVHSFATYRPGWYFGIDVFTYQLAFGLSLRWFGRQPHLRLYLGPFKLHAGGNFDGTGVEPCPTCDLPPETRAGLVSADGIRLCDDPHHLRED